MTAICSSLVMSKWSQYCVCMELHQGQFWKASM